MTLPPQVSEHFAEIRRRQRRQTFWFWMCVGMFVVGVLVTR
jgi:hypothetical protein